jgi:hypothetical protein
MMFKWKKSYPDKNNSTLLWELENTTNDLDIQLNFILTFGYWELKIKWLDVIQYKNFLDISCAEPKKAQESASLFLENFINKTLSIFSEVKS